jgi:hypothetical protein
MAGTELHVVRVEQQDPRLGRQQVHDPRSRDYPVRVSLDAATEELPTAPLRHRLFNPTPTPAQRVGSCTGVDKCVQGNAVGNRVTGKVLTMTDAERIYSLASTKYDPWPGGWPPRDTGSSGLAACKAAAELGLIERYEWVFSGARGVVAALVAGHTVGVGGKWTADMFNPDPTTGLIRASGPVRGGHQWTAIGWDPRLQAVEGLCWWGRWGLGGRGLFRIGLDDLDAILDAGGDAHITYRLGANA